MIPTDFLQTPDGDVDFSQGLRKTPDLATFAAQQLSQTLAFFQGEWHHDLRLGLPYFRDLIGRTPDLPLARAIFRRAALRTRGVGEVLRLSVAFDPATREIRITDFQAKTTEGEDIPVPAPLIFEAA